MLLYTMALFIIVYIRSFKEEFSDEHLGKLVPVLTAVVIIVIAIAILSSLSGRR